MNICSTCEEENGRIDAHYEDCWPLVVQQRNAAAVKPEGKLKEAAAVARWHADQGFTEDTSINKMRYQMKLKHKQVRFDRILIRKEEEAAAAGASPATASAGATPASASSAGPAGGGWRPKAMQLLGTHELCITTPQLGGGYQLSRKKELSVFPSDHFGLVASFQYQ